MYINWNLRELHLKIVYYGPALSGKTTNLIEIHKQVDPNRKSELVSLKTDNDRTLYFDFLELKLGKICGLSPKIKLYTVPGQPQFNTTRRVVLRGLDGIVFVADSSPDRVDANLASWDNMEENLEYHGYSIRDFPVVLQLNKRDLPNAVEARLMKWRLPLINQACFEATAFRGEGVFETLKSITQKVVAKVELEVA